MSLFYVPDAMKVVLPSGRTMRLWRGLHTLPHELVNHEMANGLGIIPENEMTDAHYRASGLKRPVPVALAMPEHGVEAPVAEEAAPEQEAEAKG